MYIIDTMLGKWTMQLLSIWKLPCGESNIQCLLIVA